MMKATSILKTTTAVLIAACALCLAFASQAFANQQLNAPTTVSDDITRIHVNKLDADTHDFVQGARMAIIEKDTGTVVDEWVTGPGTHQNEKGLDVDRVYILREVAAPDGYETVTDTEFVVNATEGTGITILSGDAELTESYKVNLYDKVIPTERVTTVTQEREVPGTTTQETPKTGQSSTGSKIVAPKTGDETPMSLVAGLVVAGIVAVFVLEIPKRRIQD